MQNCGGPSGGFFLWRFWLFCGNLVPQLCGTTLDVRQNAGFDGLVWRDALTRYEFGQAVGRLDGLTPDRSRGQAVRRFNGGTVNGLTKKRQLLRLDFLEFWGYFWVVAMPHHRWNEVEILLRF